MTYREIWWQIEIKPYPKAIATDMFASYFLHVIPSGGEDVVECISFIGMRRYTVVVGADPYRIGTYMVR